MTKGRDFIFGKDIFNPNKELTWNPDKCQTNGNGAIWGTSGSGKSRLIRKMIEYLAKQRKTIHVIDPHGDLGVTSAEIPPDSAIRPQRFSLPGRRWLRPDDVIGIGRAGR